MVLRYKDVYGQPFVAPNFDIDLNDPLKLILQREHHKNILSVIQYIHMWCQDINRLIAVSGTAIPPGDNTYHIDPLVVDATVPYDEVVSFDHVQFSFDTIGRAEITCSDEFLSQMYLAVNPVFAKMIGLSENLWGGRTPGFDIPPQPAVEFVSVEANVAENDVFAYDIQYVTTEGLSTFMSSRSMFVLDERQTLGVELTIPSSRVIQSDDSVVTEKYRLAEFALDRFVDIRSEVAMDDDMVLNTIKVSDSLEGGLLSLTDNSLGTHIIHMLPGAIRTINTRLFCNYRKWDGTRLDAEYLMDNAFWDLELLFCKKVT